jgi:hypothetical protein
MAKNISEMFNMTKEEEKEVELTEDERKAF